MEADNLNRIFDILAEMNDELSAAKTSPFNVDKVTIDRKQFSDFLLDIRTSLPEQLPRAMQVLNESESIIQNAQEEAKNIVDKAREEYDRILREATEKQSELINETEIAAKASEEAARIVKNARKVEAEYKEKARAYTDNLLEMTQDSMNEVGSFISLNGKEFSQLLTKQAGLLENYIAQIQSEIQRKYEAMVKDVAEKAEIIAENRKELRGEKDK